MAGRVDGLTSDTSSAYGFKVRGKRSRCVHLVKQKWECNTRRYFLGMGALKMKLGTKLQYCFTGIDQSAGLCRVQTDGGL